MTAKDQVYEIAIEGVEMITAPRVNCSTVVIQKPRIVNGRTEGWISGDRRATSTTQVRILWLPAIL